jgi:hypothetical protein
MPEDGFLRVSVSPILDITWKYPAPVMATQICPVAEVGIGSPSTTEQLAVDPNAGMVNLAASVV